MSLKRIEYHRPTSVDEARRLQAELPDARYLAGGTDLLVGVKNGNARPGALVSLRAIPELCGVSPDNGTTRIGALTPLAQVMADPAVRQRHPVLVQAIGRMASPQLRNVGTLGGNLCNASPCADTTSPLLVLGARARILGADGPREVPIDAFHTGPGATCLQPGEILEAVLLDSSAPGIRACFLRRGRVHVDLALAGVSVLLRMDDRTCRDVRVAASAVAPVPLRLPAVEAALEGQALDPELLSRAASLAREGVQPIDDVRASADYRRHLVGVFVARALRALASEPAA